MQELVKPRADIGPSDQLAQEHEERHRQQDVVDPHPPELELGGHQRGLEALDLPQERQRRRRQREGNGQTHRDQQDEKSEEPETDFIPFHRSTSPRRG